MTDPSLAPSSNGSNGALADAPSLDAPAAKPAPKGRRKDPAQQAQIPTTQQDIVTYEIHCVGITPIMMDHFPQKDMVEALIKKNSPPKDTTTLLEFRCPKKIYRAADGSGAVVLLAKHLLACLNGAARSIKVGKEGKLANASDTKLFAVMQLHGLEFPLIFPPGKDTTSERPFAGGEDEGNHDPNSPWRVDVQRGVGDTGIANAIIRPLFPKWGFKAKFTIDYKGLDGLTPEHIRMLFERAGKRVGLLSYNPAHKGPYGCFVVKSFTEVDPVVELDAASE